MAIKKRLDLLGAVTALLILLSISLIFISRLLSIPKLGTWFGYVDLLMAAPLIYLLINVRHQDRPVLYVIQINCMLVFLIVEALLDYILELDFRDNLSIMIPSVVLFFAGTGGMVGLAANAGRIWAIVTGILFLIMGVLAFVQRAVTGM